MKGEGFGEQKTSMAECRRLCNGARRELVAKSRISYFGAVFLAAMFTNFLRTTTYSQV
jgi:hypothetical protein